MVYKQSEIKRLKERLKQNNRKVAQLQKLRKMQDMVRRLLAQAIKDDDKVAEQLLKLILEEGK